MAKDRQLSAEERMTQRLQGISNNLMEMRQTIDNIFQHIAALARKNNMPPSELVGMANDLEKNYMYLADCIREEQALRKKKAQEQAQMGQPSAETMDAINKLSVEPGETNEQTNNVPEQDTVQATEGK